MMYSIFMTTLVVCLIVSLIYLFGICITQSEKIEDLKDELETLKIDNEEKPE